MGNGDKGDDEDKNEINDDVKEDNIYKKEKDDSLIHLFWHERDIHAFFLRAARDVHGGLRIWSNPTNEGAVTCLKIKTITKMTGEAPEVRSDKRSPGWTLCQH